MERTHTKWSDFFERISSTALAPWSAVKRALFETWLVLAAVTCVILFAGALYFIWQRSIVADLGSTYLSIWASLVANTIFFAIVGVAVIIYQKYKPERDILRKRVQHLYHRASHSALDYGEEHVKVLGCVVRSANVIARVHQFDKTFQAYRVEFSKSWDLYNLFGDIAFEDVFGVHLYGDDVATSVWGQLTSIELVRKDGTKESLFSSLVKNSSAKGPIDIGLGGFEDDLKFRLDRGEEASYVVNFWLWCKVGESHVTMSKRFVEEFGFVLENKWNGIAVVVLDEGRKDVRKLSLNDTLPLPRLRNIRPGVVHTFWWNAPE